MIFGFVCWSAGGSPAYKYKAGGMPIMSCFASVQRASRPHSNVSLETPIFPSILAVDRKN